MASEAGISRIGLKHCKLTFWVPPALQFEQIKILIDIQKIPLSFNEIFNGFYRNDIPTIFMVALERQRVPNSDTFCS